MSDYEVKNVEPIVISNDIQVRVFTLAQGSQSWSAPRRVGKMFRRLALNDHATRSLLASSARP
jgi:hypothetical protein